MSEHRPPPDPAPEPQPVPGHEHEPRPGEGPAKDPPPEPSKEAQGEMTGPISFRNGVAPTPAPDAQGQADKASGEAKPGG